jgi:hypothetical protein
MKSFFSALVIIFSLAITPYHALAQTPECTPLNEGNFEECCYGINAEENAVACRNYDPVINAGGDTQGGGPVGGGTSVGEVITVPNNFGMCNSYRWSGTAWIKINTNPFPCNGGSGGNGLQCSEGINANNEVECCNGTNGDIYAIACAQYYSSGGTIGSGSGGPQNGGVTPGTISPTPQSSSPALTACSKISFESLLDILIWLKCIIGAAIVPLVFTLAFLFFLWGMVMYIRGADDVKQRAEGKKFIYWGIIGLTVMVSVWGIVKIVNTTFGFGNAVPELQTDYLKKTPPKTP